MVCPVHPWFGASPNGIVDSAQLIKIKCPPKSAMSLDMFLSWPNLQVGDKHCYLSVNYVIDTCQPSLKQTNLFYLYVLFQTQLAMKCLGLQSCKLAIQTPAEHLELDMLLDKVYADAQIKHLQDFYFSYVLAMLADDFVFKKV